MNNSKYNRMYEYVYFENASNKIVDAFTDCFNIDYITKGTWKALSKRLVHHKKNFDRFKACRIEKEIPFSNNKNELKGVFAYLNKYSNINEEVAFTYSSKSEYSLNDPNNLFHIENKAYGFHTQNLNPNPFFCFEFTKTLIIPKGYAIRSHFDVQGRTHPKCWNIQGSLDGINWVTIDKHQDYEGLNGSHIVQKFQISDENKNNEKEFKYIKITQQKNCVEEQNNYYLHLGAIEFYGSIIRNIVL